MTPAAGAGWLAFAGRPRRQRAFKILDALWAFKYDDDVSDEVQTVLFEGDLTAWGWVWLVVGIVLIAAGFAVVSGAEWARWVGIVAASGRHRLPAVDLLPAAVDHPERGPRHPGRVRPTAPPRPTAARA